jgi:hypothetical protein
MRWIFQRITIQRKVLLLVSEDVVGFVTENMSLPTLGPQFQPSIMMLLKYNIANYLKIVNKNDFNFFPLRLGTFY